MKHIAKVLALILALAMLATVMVACGDKKDDTKSDDSAQTADNGGDSGIAGAEQTWGEITVFVPDTMTLKGGNALDEENQKALQLNSKEKALNYISISVIDDEDNALSNIDTTKGINEEYGVTDLSYTTDSGVEWKGIQYDALGYHCISAYASTGGKVYYIISAGYTTDSGELPAVLDSLK